MNMEAHKRALENLCRICGERFKTGKIGKIKYRKPTYVKDIQDEIFLLLGEDVSQDVENLHPNKLCRKCYLDIANTRNITDDIERIEKYKTASELVHSLRSEWVEHNDENCKICEKTEIPKTQFVKKPKKIKVPIEKGIPFESENEGFAHLFDSFDKTTNENISIIHKPYMWMVFNCTICLQHFKNQTVKTKCAHYFCADCLSKYFWHGQKEI